MADSGSLRQMDGVAEVVARVTTRYLCPPHFHDTYSVAVFHGPAKVWCRHRIWSLAPGQVGVLEPREVHSGTADSQDCAQDGFQLDPGLLSALFGSEEPASFPSPVIDDPDLAGRFSEAAASGNPVMLRAAVRDLFTVHGVPGRPAPAVQAGDELLRSLMTASMDWSIAEMSRAAGLSRSHFSRRIRELFGLSPRDLRRQQRVSAAYALIGRGGELSECAARAGFADQAHMTRQMRSLTGLTPGALRKAG
jgi:AraC-like DNA-binding protein